MAHEKELELIQGARERHKAVHDMHYNEADAEYAVGRSLADVPALTDAVERLVRERDEAYFAGNLTLLSERDALRAKLRDAAEFLNNLDIEITQHFEDRDASSPSPLVLKGIQTRARAALAAIKQPQQAKDIGFCTMPHDHDRNTILTCSGRDGK